MIFFMQEIFGYLILHGLCKKQVLIIFVEFYILNRKTIHIILYNFLPLCILSFNFKQRPKRSGYKVVLFF